MDNLCKEIRYDILKQIHDSNIKLEYIADEINISERELIDYLTLEKIDYLVYKNIDKCIKEYIENN